jgi:hypothetical protein
MNDNAILQQELNFRLSLLRLVTNAPFTAESGSAVSSESRQIETLCALVESGGIKPGR